MVRRSLWPGPRLGLGTTVQARPAQRSTRVRPKALGSLWLTPTAQISVGLTTVTSYNQLAPVPTLGLGTTVQAAPSQCSTRVRPSVPLDVMPTAQTASARTGARL